jgi:hypothetical protein
MAHHHADFLLSNDKWFKGVSLHYGPEGQVYFLDWSDTGECHDYDITDRDHARIYTLSYKGTKHVDVDLSKASDAELVQMQRSNNEWYVQHARVVLRDRGLKDEATHTLRVMLDEDHNAVYRLRAMWTLHMCGALDHGRLMNALADQDEYVRAWAIQLLAEDKKPGEDALAKFATMAKEDSSALVRLYLASAMQRLPFEQRKAVMEALLAHGEDAADQNLPLMYWYALEPMVGADKKAAAQMLGKIKIAKVREFVARRMAVK